MFDKAISVGEKSLLKSKDIKISNSNIGVAVKDYSKFINESITIKNTSNCIQAFQKKQEFGGAYVDLNNVSCVVIIKLIKIQLLILDSMSLGKKKNLS